MRITQGTFSFLPDLTDEQIAAQVQYALDNDWPISIEYTDDPHPRNAYWEMYGLPMFDLKDAAAVMDDVRRAVAEHPNEYVKVNAYDARRGRQTTALSFIVGRPPSRIAIVPEAKVTLNGAVTGGGTSGQQGASPPSSSSPNNLQHLLSYLLGQ